MQNLKVIQINNSQEWIRARVGDVTLHPQYGWTTSAKKSEVGLKLLRTTDISHGLINWSTVPVCEEEPAQREKYLLEDGDILVSRAGSIGLSCFIENPPDAIFASYLIRFKAKEEIIKSKLLYYFFQSPSYWQYIGVGESGIAIPNVNATKLSDIEITFPKSIVEQQKIIDEFESLFPLIEFSQDKILKAKQLVKLFREAVLVSAVTGKLTEDWREKNNMPEWQEKSLSEICSTITDGDHQPPPKTSEGIPFLVISDINKGELNLTPRRFVPLSYYENLAEIKRAKRGDILYSVVGSYGVPVLVNTDEKFVFQRHIALLRPKQEVNSEFLLYLMRSRIVFNQATEYATGTAQMTVPLTGLRRIIIDLPSFNEQIEIVRRIRQYFELAKNVESQIEKSQVRISTLIPSILSKTFDQHENE